MKKKTKVWKRKSIQLGLQNLRLRYRRIMMNDYDSSTICHKLWIKFEILQSALILSSQRYKAFYLKLQVFINNLLKKENLNSHWKISYWNEVHIRIIHLVPTQTWFPLCQPRSNIWKSSFAAMSWQPRQRSLLVSIIYHRMMILSC